MYGVNFFKCIQPCVLFLFVPVIIFSTSNQSNLVVRGPEAEPGKWVQSFFLNVFILYRYCSL